MSLATAVVNCDLYTPDVCIPQGAVLVEDGVLTAIGPSVDVSLPPAARVIDADGGRVTPGLIDLTRFGEGARPPAWPVNYGVTSVVWEQTVTGEADLARLARAAGRIHLRRHEMRLVGLHLVLLWAPATVRVWQEVWEASQAAIRMLTLPLHADLSPDLLRAARAAHVTPVLAPAEATQLADLDREGAILRLRQPWHLSAATVLVTPNDDKQMVRELWRLFGPDRFLLCSSARQPLQTQSVRELMSAGASFGQALAAATRLPADRLGLPQGRLTPGAPADLICWTRRGELAWTMVGGRILFPAVKSEGMK